MLEFGSSIAFSSVMLATTKTKHSADCSMTFGRKDPNCPRCVELIAGAAPRAWGISSDAKRVREIRAHVCRPSCLPVCTFGEF